MLETQEELGEELCDYCTRHTSNFSTGCEESYCNEAYERYCEDQEEEE